MIPVTSSCSLHVHCSGILGSELQSKPFLWRRSATSCDGLSASCLNTHIICCFSPFSWYRMKHISKEVFEDSWWFGDLPSRPPASSGSGGECRTAATTSVARRDGALAAVCYRGRPLWLVGGRGTVRSGEQAWTGVLQRLLPLPVMRKRPE